MSDDKRSAASTPGSGRPKTEAQIRRMREAAALRANLQRRKQQARLRRGGGGGPGDGSTDASAGA